MTPADVRLGLFQRLSSLVALGHFQLIQLGPQHLHRGVFVGMLGALILTANHRVGRYVSNTYGRVSRVYVLTTSTRGAVSINPQIRGIDVDLDIIIDFRRSIISVSKPR